jgi:glycerol-3-phosphate dehydrogenase
LLTTSVDGFTENCSGSTISNYVEFKELLYDERGKVRGVKAFDKINTKLIEKKAKVVVNCAGILSDVILNKDDPNYNKLITVSKGTHIIIKNNIFGIDSGLMIPKTTDGRVLFILPYQGYFLIGTTDEYSDKAANVFPEEREVNYLVNELKVYFRMDESVIRNNITAKWSGLRPLFNERSISKTDSKSISRGHIIKRNEQGLVSVFGGKWTTYRKMGDDVIEFLRKERMIEVKTDGDCLNMKLLGSYHVENLEKSFTYKEEREILENLKLYLESKFGIDKKTAEKMVFYYGFKSIDVLEEGAINNRNVKLLEDTHVHILESQVVYSVRHEMAIKPNDILCRRLGLGFLDEKLTDSLVEKVANIMAKELNWNDDRKKKEIDEARNNLKYLL